MQSKLKLSFFLLAAFVLLSLNSWAQSKGTAAYIITAANDTIQGTVKKHQVNGITSTLSFKPAGESKYKTYSTEEVSAFVLNNSLYFETMSLTQKEMQQQAFVQVLVDGPVKLYHSENLGTTGEYFVQKPNQPVVPLRKNSLAGTLTYLLSDCDSTGKPKAYKYTTEKLAATIDAYNMCRYPGEESKSLLVHAKLQYRWGVRAGTVLSSFSYSDRMYGENITSERNLVGPGLTGGLFMNVSEPTTNFGLQAELLLKIIRNKTHSTGTGIQLIDYTFDSELQATFLQVPVLLRYSRKIGSSWSPYLAVGPSFGYLINPVFHNSITYQDKYHTYTEERDEQVNPFAIGFTAGAGVEYAFRQSNSLIFDIRYGYDRTQNRYDVESASRTRNLDFSSILLTAGISF